MKFSFIENGKINAGKYEKVDLINNLVISNHYALQDVKVRGEFKWTQDFLNEEIKAGTTLIAKSDKLSLRFIRSGEGYKRPTNFIKDKYITPVLNKKENNVGTNESASSELKALMGEEVFSYPKPISLLEHLIGFNIDEGDIVMDFFAGSGTTAHGLWSYSLKNRTKLRFILVQLDEDLELQRSKVKDPNLKRIIQNGIDLLISLKKPFLLTELTKERIRRAGKKIVEDNADKKSIENLDIGFRVLKIDSTNMKDVYYTPDNLKQADLLDLASNIKEDRTSEDLLFQVMLDWGIELSLPIERKIVAGKEVFFVAGNSLVACFDDLTFDVVDEVAKDHPLRFVSAEKAIHLDHDKTNIKERFKQLSPDTEVKFL